MALQVWLPLLGTLENLGVSDLEFSVANASYTSTDTNGKIGNCYKNTSNTAGGIVSNKTINLGTNLSMFCWVKLNSFYNSSSLTGILGQHRYPANEGMGITMRYVSSTTGYLSVNTGNGSSRTYNTYYGNTLLSAGTWYHVGFTYDGSKITLYVNGVNDKEVSYSGQKNIADYVQVFCWSFNETNVTQVLHGNYTLNGFVNDVRIYDHCLSSKEVKEISKGLASHYKLDDAYVGTITNMLTAGGTYSTTTGSTWTGHYYVGTIEDAVGPVPFSKMNKLAITVSGSSTGGGASLSRQTNIPVQPSTTYMYSTYVKPSDNFTYTHANFLYRYEYDSAGTKTIEQGINTPSKREYVGDGWYRIWNTFTTQATTSKMHVYFYTYPGKTMTYYLGGCQLEIGDVLHPYTEGTSANGVVWDCSGYGNNGNITGTLTTETGSPRYSSCTKFGGHNCYFLAKNPFYNNVQPITIAFWYKPNASNSSYDTIISNTAPHGGFWLGVNVEGYTIWSYNSGLYVRGASGSLANGTWYHIVWQYKGNNQYQWYLNGQAITTTTSGTLKAPVFTEYFNVGGCQCADNSTSSSRYDQYGSVSDLRIYGSVLSTEDVIEIYHTSASIDNKGNFHCYELKEV